MSVACLLCATAQAGTYDVTSCNPDGSAAGWSAYANGSWVRSSISCPANGDQNRGLSVANAPNAGIASSSGGGLQFKAPSGTSLAGIGAGLRLQRWDSTYWIGLITASGSNIYGAWGDGGGSGYANATTPYTWFGLNHESDVHLEIGCPGFCDTAAFGSAPYYRVWAQAYDPIRIRIEDNNAPSETITGGSLLASQYVAGVQDLAYTATDASGIRVTRLYVDGAKLHDDTRTCNFENPVPCSNVAKGTYTVDTRSLSDGTHSVSVETIDSAGNSTSQSRTIRVDNHAPPAPSVTVAGGEGWRNADRFELRWTNPSGDPSPIAKAHYEICRADEPANCAPVGEQSAVGISSLSDLSVPVEGDYTVRVWLEDSAGNTSAGNSSGPVHLRFDATAPPTVRDLSVDGGEGWRATNSFDVAWTNPDDELAPLAGATYRLCDVDGNCTTAFERGDPDIHSLSRVSVPQAGDYTATVWLTDAAGNADERNVSATVHLRFDNADPGAASAMLPSDWLNANDVRDGYEVRVGLTDPSTAPVSGIAGYAVTSDGSDPGSAANVGVDGLFRIRDLSDGAMTVKVRAISGAGVVSREVGSSVLKVDTQPPAVSAEGAPDPNAWQAAPVALALRASDQPDLSGMSSGRVSYSLDEHPWVDVSGEVARLTVDADGEHTIRYIATDTAGNSTAVRELKVRIDSTPPADVVADDPGRWLDDAEARDYEASLSSPSGSAAPLSGLAGYSFTIDGSYPDATADTGHDRLELGSLPEGETVVRARAVSGSGLASLTAAPVTLRVDRTPPEVSLAGAPDPEAWIGGAAHLNLAASDARSGMHDGGYVAYAVDDAPAVTVAGDAATVAVTSDGPHTLSYYAVDAAGNRSATKQVTFKLDEERPGRAVPADRDGWITTAGPIDELIRLGDGELLPASGLSGFSVTTDGSEPDSAPDTGPDGRLTLNDLPDGVTTVKARAVSGAGVPSDAVGSVSIRVDRTAPLIRLHKPSGALPAEIVADASDATSGIASGEIELRPQGAADWQKLPAELQSGRLTAGIDPAALAGDSYELRVSATDAAGNVTRATKFANGNPATFTVSPPLQAAPVVEPPHPTPASPPARRASRAVIGIFCPRVYPHARRHVRGRRGVRLERRVVAICGRFRHKGGEKHRHRHLARKTHKPARRIAG